MAVFERPYQIDLLRTFMHVNAATVERHRRLNRALTTPREKPTMPDFADLPPHRSSRPYRPKPVCTKVRGRPCVP